MGKLPDVRNDKKSSRNDILCLNRAKLSTKSTFRVQIPSRVIYFIHLKRKEQNGWR